jgi:5-formyltetrahydrofolate cyclo-ligase
MDDAPVSELFELKNAIRKQAHENRRAQPEKDSVSAKIVDRFMGLSDYEEAKTVMFYVDVRDEVRTRQALPAALSSGKRIVVPYCLDGELELFWLESMDELELGMYRILEPRNELRTVAAKHLQPADLDCVMVPGVAFDRNGGRTGHGKGYYDKLLQHARLDAPLIALAFECQMFERIPAESHDIYMDKIVTENAVYQGKGRNSSHG